jgi:hypothetical protein
VIVAEGFYEWKTVGAEPKKGKQPYFIYAAQTREDVKISDSTEWENAEWSETEGWKGPKLLHIAGLYDVWKSKNVFMPSFSSNGNLANRFFMPYYWLLLTNYCLF